MCSKMIVILKTKSLSICSCRIKLFMMSMISSMSLLMMSWAGLIRLRTMLEYDLFIFISISFDPTLRKINREGLGQDVVNSEIYGKKRLCNSKNINTFLKQRCFFWCALLLPWPSAPTMFTLILRLPIRFCFKGTHP